MTVLLRVVRQLGHRHFAALPPAVEGMVEEPAAGEGLRYVE